MTKLKAVPFVTEIPESVKSCTFALKVAVTEKGEAFVGSVAADERAAVGPTDVMT